MTVTSKIVKKTTLSFLKEVKIFCDEKNIDFSLKSFLNYKTSKNQYLPDCYRLLLGPKPQMLLSNSKLFNDFYYSLDYDIRQDIIKEDKIKRGRAIAMSDRDLQKTLRDLLRKDYIYG